MATRKTKKTWAVTLIGALTYTVGNYNFKKDVTQTVTSAKLIAKLPGDGTFSISEIVSKKR